MNSVEFGNRSEAAAAAYLKRKGYAILHTHWRTRRGEIDIVCQKEDVLVFVEVKSAAYDSVGYLAERINTRKRRRIQLAALDYVSHNKIPAGGTRFDAVLLTLTREGEYRIEHIPDAFRNNDPVE